MSLSVSPYICSVHHSLPPSPSLSKLTSLKHAPSVILSLSLSPCLSLSKSSFYSLAYLSYHTKTALSPLICTVQLSWSHLQRVSIVVLVHLATRYMPDTEVSNFPIPIPNFQRQLQSFSVILSHLSQLSAACSPISIFSSPHILYPHTQMTSIALLSTSTTPELCNIVS